MHEFSDCIAPKLKHFQGRPRDFSPKARFWAFLGYKLPLTDTIGSLIDVAKMCVTCSIITKVRAEPSVSDPFLLLVCLITNYFIGPEKDGVPASIYLDIRPALDSVEAGVDRVKMALKKMFGGGNDSKQTQQ